MSRNGRDDDDRASRRKPSSHRRHEGRACPSTRTSTVGQTETAATERWNERLERRHDTVAVDLLSACVSDDVAAASALMAASVTLYVDGGGKVRAPTEPVVGARDVARFLLELGSAPEMVVRPRHINGQIGLAFHRKGRVVGVLSFLVGSGEISDIWIVLNPDKLRRWNPKEPV